MTQYRQLITAGVFGNSINSYKSHHMLAILLFKLLADSGVIKVVSQHTFVMSFRECFLKSVT